MQSVMGYLSTTMREHEIDTLRSFCLQLRSSGVTAGMVNDFSVGFRIPQISKEFDLLRICDDTVINIELKSKYSDKALGQLKKNNYYLKVLGKEVLCFTYCQDLNTLYKLNSKSDLEEATMSELRLALAKQRQIFRKDLSELFDPIVYLVSPFNTTDKFLNGEYFLTSHQEKIAGEVVTVCDKGTSSIASIRGTAGTGKSLLVYHIAKELMQAAQSVAIIHVGQLNSGHHTLLQHKWNIFPIKDLQWGLEISQNIRTLLVDEAQRLDKRQLASIIDFGKSSTTNIVFGHDRIQTLCKREEEDGISDQIDSISGYKYTLTDKIRTNKEISDFLRIITGEKKAAIKKTYNTSIVCFGDINDAKEYIYSRNAEGWTYISHTPSQYNPNKWDKLLDIGERGTAHEVIGQEFDKVIAVIDDTFFYDEAGVLGSTNLSGNPYLRGKMFLQAVTRTRKQLELVIVGNPIVYQRMLSFFE